MTSGRLRYVVAVALALGVPLTVACDAVGSASSGATPRPGGTLRVVVVALPTHLDPQRVRTATEVNVSRLISRTLTMYRSEPGRATELVGDLATDAGRPGTGNASWEFTLRAGVTWPDGTPITCADVKYGVERGYAGQVPAVAPYPRMYLADNARPYAGPSVAGNNNGRGLESVHCPDPRTVRFSLRAPAADFGAIVSSPVFAPTPVGVRPAASDAYDAQPLPSGPYRVGERTAERLTLVRNAGWDSATDAVRKAYPDQIVLTVGRDQTAVTANLVESDGAWADTIALDLDVASGYLQQVRNDARLAARLTTGTSGAVRYFAINTRRISDVRCRKALVYAFNHRKARDVAGGASAGRISTSMLAPDITAQPPTDVYGATAHPGGQLDVARGLRAEVDAKGAACPAVVRIAFPEQPDVRRLVSTIIDPYRLLGVEVRLNPIEPGGYSDAVSSSADVGDLVYGSWTPAWPAGAAVIAPLFDGRYLPRGTAATNLNLSRLNDPAINSAITAALAEPDPARQDTAWAALDAMISDRAAAIPVLHPQALRLAGRNVRGAFLHPRLGQPDLAALGLAMPSGPAATGSPPA